MIRENEAAAVKSGSLLTVNGKLGMKVSGERQFEKDRNSPSETKAFDVELDDGTKTALYVTWHYDLSAYSANVKAGGSIIDITGININTEKDIRK